MLEVHPIQCTCCTVGNCTNRVRKQAIVVRLNTFVCISIVQTSLLKELWIFPICNMNLLSVQAQIIKYIYYICMPDAPCVLLLGIHISNGFSFSRFRWFGCRIICSASTVFFCCCCWWCSKRMFWLWKLKRLCIDADQGSCTALYWHSHACFSFYKDFNDLSRMCWKAKTVHD